MLVGKLSVEWLLVAIIGLVVTTAIAIDAPNRVLRLWEYWATGLVILALNFFVFRLLGRTTATTIESGCAAHRGHPRLTAMTLILHALIWSCRPIILTLS